MSSTSMFRASAPKSIRTSTSRSCIRSAELGIRSAMALPERLTRAVSTTAFRVAAVTVSVYLIFAGLIVGALLWQANRVLSGEVLATLQSEAELLRSEAQSGGREALREAIEKRSRSGGPGLYFLGDEQ